MTSDDRVNVTSLVSVGAKEAFALFTDEVDLWWRRGPRYRSPKDGRMRFHPGVGGRLVEEFPDGGEFEVGRIKVWEPGARLVLDWKARNFRPGETTELEILFQPCEAGTRVIIEHRGFAALPPDHPVRHGMQGRAFIDMIGLWWAELATSLRLHAD